MAKILVIDDEGAILNLLRSALELSGHEVMDAANGHVGLTFYQQCPADLVITNIRMPPLTWAN